MTKDLQESVIAAVNRKPVAPPPPPPLSRQPKIPETGSPQKNSTAHGLLNNRHLGGWYLFASVLILLLTTIFWSYLGARVHQQNADQLVNSLLFENAKTFKGATIPSAHTLLLKWPLFYLIHLLGSTSAALTVATITLSLITVLAFAYLLSRIERRPLVLGTVYVAMASCLLLVPIQPYAGALLPVSMAMLATRNVEYILLLVALVALAATRRVRSWQFAAATAILGLLFASDRLFLTLSLGGATVMFLFYAVCKHWKLVTTALNWFFASLLGGILALVLIWAISVSHLTSFYGQTGTGPYSVTIGTHNVAIGLTYAVGGLFTNMGANPAVSATIIRNLPKALSQGFRQPSGLIYLTNLLITAVGLWACWSVIHGTVSRKKRRISEDATATHLSIMLVASSLVGFLAYIITDHYYAVDARYLAILFFTIFVCLVTWLRLRTVRARNAIIVGIILLLSCMGGLAIAWHGAQTSLSAQNTNFNRNQTINEALKSHPVDSLLGDYWRTVAIKQNNQNANITPLQNCTEPRQVLSSSNWQPDLNNHSFAYLISFDKSATDFPNCSLETVLKKYGRPNASVVIEGNLANPKEQLLFYDHGIQKSGPAVNLTSQPSTITPIPTDALPNTNCSGPTVLTFVAHQDDDLLFMNPQTVKDIEAGKCLRTVYLTAGDAGSNQFYWLSREQGSQAAYSQMLHSNAVWIQRIVKIGPDQYVTVANPKGNTKISLIYMHLPDGNLKGEGFAATHHQSLEKLLQDRIPSITAIYGNSTYTKASLISTLADIMNLYGPAVIRTQSTINNLKSDIKDHSDHNAVGHLVTEARNEYQNKFLDNRVTIPIDYYLGYPERSEAVNLSEPEINETEAIFFTYAKYDPSVCRTEAECNKTQTYGSYLKRQYLVNH